MKDMTIDFETVDEKKEQRGTKLMKERMKRLQRVKNIALVIMALSFIASATLTVLAESGENIGNLPMIVALAIFGLCIIITWCTCITETIWDSRSQKKRATPVEQLSK